MWLIFKRKFLIYILCIILIITFQLARRYSSLAVFVKLRDPLQKKVIVIDPGHGGIDGGTNREGLLEKNINLEIALKLREILERNNASVVMTREKDTALDHLNNYSSSRHLRDLSARRDIINQNDADLFISIHINAGSSHLSGPLVIYREEDQRLAHLLQTKLNSMEYKDIELKSNYPLQGNYFLLNTAQVEGVIVEIGYITNSRDNKLLQDEEYQYLVAKTLFSGIEEYFSSFTFYLEKIEKNKL
jgi:N-acetylmuramoyl-L-alanine amidase